MPALNSSDDANDLDGFSLMTQRKEEKKRSASKAAVLHRFSPVLVFPLRYLFPRNPNTKHL